MSSSELPAGAAPLALIDCDIHPKPGPDSPLDPFVPEAFREAIRIGLANQPGNGYANPFGVDRRDAVCNDPAATAHDHLDRYDIAFGVLQSPGMAVSLSINIDVGSALARAWNDWQTAHWLSADPRYLGSIAVNMNDPAVAAAEIHRAHAAHPRMVQVLACGEATHLYGHRAYWPVYQACHDLGLPFALHPGREGVLHSPTPVGRPSSYFEWHTLIPLTYQAHLVSMLAEGVFEKFPHLKLILTEAGIAWLPHTLWRMDKNFKALRTAVPWLKELPSTYAHRHVYLTTQPLEEPARPEHLLQIFDMVHAEANVLFASDYPHWDFDDPLKAFPRQIDARLRRRIFYDNAAELYGLPAAAPAAETAGAA